MFRKVLVYVRHVSVPVWGTNITFVKASTRSKTIFLVSLQNYCINIFTLLSSKSKVKILLIYDNLRSPASVYPKFDQVSKCFFFFQNEALYRGWIMWLVCRTNQKKSFVLALVSVMNFQRRHMRKISKENKKQKPVYHTEDHQHSIVSFYTEIWERNRRINGVSWIKSRERLQSPSRKCDSQTSFKVRGCKINEKRSTKKNFDLH